MTTTRPDVPAGLANFRDLGGLPTDDGRTTRPGILYRSDAPQLGDPAPNAPAWPPTLVIDLRSPTEPVDPHPLRGDGTQVHLVPLLADARPPTLAELRAGSTLPLGAIYRAIVERATSAIPDILQLLTSSPGPTLVHCAAGKDRTGVMIAVLLRAAGVTHHAVVTDYTLTAARMNAVRGRLPTPDPDQAALVAEFPQVMAASATTIADVLEPLERHPGGPQGWLRDRHVPGALIRRWTDRLTGLRRQPG